MDKFVYICPMAKRECVPKVPRVPGPPEPRSTYATPPYIGAC